MTPLRISRGVAVSSGRRAVREGRKTVMSGGVINPFGEDLRHDFHPPDATCRAPAVKLTVTAPSLAVAIPVASTRAISINHAARRS